MVDLEGVQLGPHSIDITGNLDFIACSSDTLLKNIIDELEDFRGSKAFTGPKTKFMVLDS